MAEKGQQKIVIYWNTKRTIALICSILIVPIISVLILSLTLKTSVINPEFYKANLKKVDTYNRLIDEVVPAVILNLSSDRDAINSSITKDLLVVIIQKSIDPAWIEGLTNKIIDQIVLVFSKISDQSQVVDLNLRDSQVFLQKLSNSLIFLESVIPNCSSQPAEAKILCGSDNNLDEIKEEIHELVGRLNNINLGVIDITEQVSEANAYILSLKNFIAHVNTFFYVSLAIFLLLVLTIVLLCWDNLPLMIKSVALPIILSTFFGMVFVLIVKSFVLVSLPTVQFNFLPKAAVTLINDIIRANIEGIFNRYEVIAGIFLGFFVLLYALVLILEKTGFKFFGLKEK